MYIIFAHWLDKTGHLSCFELMLRYHASFKKEVRRRLFRLLLKFFVSCLLRAPTNTLLHTVLRKAHAKATTRTSCVLITFLQSVPIPRIPPSTSDPSSSSARPSPSSSSSPRVSRPDIPWCRRSSACRTVPFRCNPPRPSPTDGTSSSRRRSPPSPCACCRNRRRCRPDSERIRRSDFSTRKKLCLRSRSRRRRRSGWRARL
mmetsp:Transcript_59968/g.177815  ORF Transcript_59968/g.177815 Transcript_59968/m.177815 type:complete len:202 (+) Transcript_59968:171-776(+)